MGRVGGEDRQRETGRPSLAAPLLFLGPDRSDLDDLIVFVMHFRNTRHQFANKIRRFGHF
jgi:hypothetical protein